MYVCVCVFVCVLWQEERYTEKLQGYILAPNGRLVTVKISVCISCSHLDAIYIC